MGRRRPDRRDVAQRREGHAADDKGDAEHEVLVDDSAGAARELHQEGQPAQVVVHQRDGRAVNRHLAAGGAHSDADVARGQRGGVVDAVADDRDFVALGFHLAHKFDLVLRQAFTFGFLAPDFKRDPGGDSLAVARNHRDAPHTALF